MASTSFLCARCIRALHLLAPARPTLSMSSSTPHPAAAQRRLLSRSAVLSNPAAANGHPPTPESRPSGSSSASESPPRPPDPAPGPAAAQNYGSSQQEEQGPMSRRLEQATEDALLTGGRAGRRAISDAGFSEELKARLLDKLADAQFTTDHTHALDEAGLTSRIPPSAGEGTRATATAQPWTGQEAAEDAVLRMLNDARKPLAPAVRAKAQVPAPQPVDMRMRRSPAVSAGRRAASARDRAQAYADLGVKGDGTGLSEVEREAMKREFRERFTPGARAMPNTITGLAALANERIENAIARGQFKNIPRGKGVERDTRADNPFIDTTEYIMNKMIKRQEIVPPWIEKQQELLKAANNFRGRLREDWKRHAARMIASRGGSLEEQMARAKEYARAEEVHNPRRRAVDQITVPSNTTTEDVVMLNVRVEHQQKPRNDASLPTEPVQATITRPFRDPDWEAAEASYMNLAISNLNAITRSYNLMAPELAKKPYFTLERELLNCFADVAPLVADEIKQRAAKPARSLIDPVGHGPRSMMDRFGKEGKMGAKIYDSKTPNYGLREMWRDFWKR